MQEHRPLVFAGENPIMTLYAPDDEARVAVASYWRCLDSPWGMGQALVLWVAGAAMADHSADMGFVYTDQPALARRLNETFTQHFPEFERLPVLDFPLRRATLAQHWDGQCYEVRCHAAGGGIDLRWEEPLDRKRFTWPDFPLGAARYDLSNVLLPCGTASLRVDGLLVRGEVRTPRDEARPPRSSAFLALCESWVGPLAEPKG